MILISHELPHSLQREDNEQHHINDYLFVLLHRYNEDHEYRKIVDAYDGLKIMDNSCFELGEALSNELIDEYIGIMNPDYFVLPDTLGNLDQTVERTLQFLEQYPHHSDKAMAVIQGETVEATLACYEVFKELNIPYIGIPFCYNWAFDANMTPVEHANERVKLMFELDKIVDKSKKHHLLGTWSAHEFTRYKDYDWITSLDTSNPVAAGIELSRYPITHKPRPKFDEFATTSLMPSQKFVIIDNVRIFKEMVNG